MQKLKKTASNAGPALGGHAGARRGGRLVIATLVATAGIALAACSSGSPSSVSGSVSGSSGSASGAAGQLPSGFPKDVPVPSNSRVLGGASTGNQSDAAFAVPKPFASATAAYASKLRSAGYTVSNVVSGASGSAAGATFSANDSKWSLQVAAGTSASSATEGTLKPGEFVLNVTVLPANSTPTT